MIELLTIADTAAVLKCGELTVRRMIKRGKLHGLRVGRYLRISKDEVARFIENKENSA